jgi:hypothetical protein
MYQCNCGTVDWLAACWKPQGMIVCIEFMNSQLLGFEKQRPMTGWLGGALEDITAALCHIHHHFTRCTRDDCRRMHHRSLNAMKLTSWTPNL